GAPRAGEARDDAVQAREGEQVEDALAARLAAERLAERLRVGVGARVDRVERSRLEAEARVLDDEPLGALAGGDLRERVSLARLVAPAEDDPGRRLLEDRR